MASKARNNIFYAQSGGATAVINASACGVIEAAREHSDKVGNVLVGKNGILGALNEELIDTSQESVEAIRGLRHTPSSAFGSCRYKLKSLEENREQYQRLIEVFEAHDIGYFFYNGGGDSQDTSHKVSLMSQEMGVPITCIGIPKTVDNDLAFTDNCPGFGSVAKYVAISTLEAGLDVAGMASTSTKVFILEVMGRHAGWIAAAGGLASDKENEPPHIILLPEVPFNERAFINKVKESVEQNEYCVIVVSEGVRDEHGKFLSDAGTTDAFGHAQLGGVAPYIANLVKEKTGYKYHWAVADYLQRAARHIASKTDVDQAYALGRAAVEFALEGHDGVMLTIERKETQNYQWEIGTVPLDQVANIEKEMPAEFIHESGLHITDACREYLAPLIEGEDYPPYKNGLPQYVRLKKNLAPKKLSTAFELES